ncbi:small conductance mechanosensitive channel [Spirosomataceae bacterium TFI 002]|nr:small conductance mechanosensitive channel [Spirosomataceae bacterium TFI 002]
MDKLLNQLSGSYQNVIVKLQEWINLIILNIPNLIIALLLTVIAYFASNFVRKIAVKSSKRFTENRTILNLVSNLSAVLFSVLMFLLILSVFDLGGTINKILATAGVLGLAVGLALQDPMNNLFSGVFMSVRELYKIGDLVETNGHFGTIQNIDLRATKLKLPTGQEVVIPNKDVLQSPLMNYTVSGERRIDVSCGVSYGDDLEKVEEVVLSAIKSIPGILVDKSMEIIYTEFGDSSINFTVRYWMTVSGQKDCLLLKSKGIKAIKTAFENNDILIPFPIRTLDFGIKGGVSLNNELQVLKS